MLSQQDIKNFQQIWLEEFGEKISSKLALEYGTNLINLMRVVYQPIPDKKGKNEKK